MTHDRRKPGIGRRTLLTTALAAPALILPRALRAQAPTQAAPRRGGTLNMILNPEPPVLVLGVNNQGPTLAAASKIYQGLLRYNFRLEPQPELAKSWTLSPDGTTYTFQLQENVKWHDGRPLTADDVVFSITKFHMELSPRSRAIFQRITEVTATGPTTVVIKIREPFEPFLLMFDVTATAIVPKHIYDGTDIPTNPANRAPVGLGPFRFVKWEEGRGITFERNEHYWDQPRPYLDSVVAVFIPNVQQQQNALYRGEIDVLRPALPQVGRTVEQAKAKGAFEVREIKVNAAERLSLDMNITRDVLNKPLIRQALLTAIDRERISKDVYQGLAFPAMNAIPEQFAKLTDPSVDYNKQFAYDPAKAGKMLDEAGFPLKDGKRFALELTGAVNADAFYAEPAAQIIAANWRAIGIDVKLSLLEGQLWTNKVFKERNFDVSMVSLTARTDPLFGVDRSFLCNKGNVPYVNPTGYCNAELDEIAAKAAAVPLDERRQWYKKYEEIIARDMPHLTLTNAKKFFAVSSRFGGIDEELDLAFNGNPSMSNVWVK